MNTERKKDISVFYWLKDLFPTVTVVDEFPLQELELPTISVEWDEMSSDPFELGNRQGDYLRSWYFNIFAKTKSQRDDLSYALVEALENPIPVLDYDMGFPPEVTNQTKLGHLRPFSVRIKKIAIYPELVSKLYYRTQVLFLAEYSPN